MKGFIIFEDFIHFITCKEILDGDYNCVISDYANGTFSGIINRVTGASCTPKDTYDFETGALIALMKMCGFDKSYKAIEEAFKYNSYDAKKSKELNTPKRDNDKVKDLDVKEFYNKLSEENINLKKEKEQIIVAKNILYNKLEEENKELKKRINDLEIYNNKLEERVAAEQRGGYKFLKDMEKLQHEYDLCKNSENALKCSVAYLNKTIAKLNMAIDGYKNDLYKVSKRCIELEAKEDILNKQEKTINKREEEISVYFGGRGTGKQYKALVELFKKLDQKKVDAAYKEAYNTNLPLWQKEVLKQMYEIHEESKEKPIWLTSQPSIRDQLDSFIEGSKYAIPYADKWIKPPTTREKMWAEIFELHKESDVIIKVKKEDVNTFLHEIENKIPEITWLSTVKIFETKYTIGDIYEELKTRDMIYFRLWKDNRLSYSSDEFIYAFKGFHHIDYLPPMRWDLFKKGRLVVGVRKEHYDEFISNATEHIYRFNKHKPYDNFNYSFFIYDKNANFIEAIGRSQFRQIKEMNNHKVIYWEDVR